MAHHRKRAPDKAGQRGGAVRASLKCPLLLPDHDKSAPDKAGQRGREVRAPLQCPLLLPAHDKGEHRTKLGNAEGMSAPS